MVSGYLAPTPAGGLAWGQELLAGRLVRRYKRFLADVELAGGGLVTAHTPNTGRMTGCCEPGRRVWLSRHDTPGRRHPLTWEMIEMPAALVGLNTLLPNKLVAAAGAAGLIEGLGPVAAVEREVTVGRSRLDLRFTGPGGEATYVEVKNCTLAEGGVAYFPDAVTARGAKHMEELAALAGRGLRAAVFILVQRADAGAFRPADRIDPAWGLKLRAAVAAGVEVWAYRADLGLAGVALGPRLPVWL